MMRWAPGRRILPTSILGAALFILVSPRAPASIPNYPQETQNDPAASRRERRDAIASTKPLVRARRVRVRIAEALPRLRVSGQDLRVFEGGGTSLPHIVARMKGKATWDLRCQDGRVRAIREEGDGGQETMELAEPVTLESPAGFLKFDGHNYRETVRVWSTGSFCEVVNEVDMEKYLEGLVNAEFSSRWSAQAVEAQIVAARSYALYQMDQRQPRFDLDSTEKDQVYHGPDREDPRAAKLVSATRGLVLIAANGPPTAMKAFYHSTCGGETETPEHVWGTKLPGFGRVKCPFCATSPRYRWELPLTSADLAQAIARGARIDGAQLGWPAGARDWIARSQVVDIHLEEFPESGRVASVRLSWLDKKTGRMFATPVTGARFRSWIGVGKLLSANFAVRPPEDPRDSTWRFEGKGNGHGVGMCQWGAKVMGERGFTMASILRHYYPGAVIRKFW